MRYFIKTISLFIFVFSCCEHAAQTKTKQTPKNSSPFYRTKQTNVLYIGVENSFVLYKDSPIKYGVNINNGKLVPIDTTSKDSAVYAIHVMNTNPTTINITKGSETFIHKFRNKKVPSPELKIYMGPIAGYSKGGNVKADDFSKAVSVVLELNNFDYNAEFRIINMEITKVSEGGKTNDLLTDNQIEKYTKACVAGDIYIFHNIVIEFLNTKDQRSIVGTTFFIK